jgi:hypothetical protein
MHRYRSFIAALIDLALIGSAVDASLSSSYAHRIGLRAIVHAGCVMWTLGLSAAGKLRRIDHTFHFSLSNTQNPFFLPINPMERVVGHWNMLVHALGGLEKKKADSVRLDE